MLLGAGHVIASAHWKKAEPYNFFTPAEARLVKLVLADERRPGQCRSKAHFRCEN